MKTKLTKRIEAIERQVRKYGNTISDIPEKKSHVVSHITDTLWKIPEPFQSELAKQYGIR